MARLLLLGLLLCAACGTSQPQVPMARFLAGDLGVVADFARREATEGPVENQALLLNILAQCELLQGDSDAAWRHFGVAAGIMGNWQTSGGEEFAAIVGSESSKTYKGDPYEKAMNAFYLGFCYLLKGEPDNARAAFKKGILADGESGDEKFQADFTLLFWLAARMSRAMGLPGDAEDFVKETQQADAFARQHGSRGQERNPLIQDPLAGNLVLLAEVGLGPEKYAAGKEQELARFRPRWHAARRAQIWIDGELRGPTFMLADVDYQAQTRGGTEMEGIRRGKAVFKSVARTAGTTALILAAGDESRAGSRDKALIGAGLLVVSALTASQADVRHWPTLPSSVQGAAFTVAPGVHEVRIDFLSGEGQVLADLSQTWSVDVPEGGESYYLFRSLPNLNAAVRSKS